MKLNKKPKDRRYEKNPTSVSLTPEQKELVKKLADLKHEGTQARAMREIFNAGIQVLFPNEKELKQKKPPGDEPKKAHGY